MTSTADDRRVWVIEVPDGDEYGVGPVQVLVEQFGTNPPTIAFRRQSHDVWGRPYRGAAR
jgi:hypothetical protein